jgi:3-dehydroquinate dehydratase-2
VHVITQVLVLNGPDLGRLGSREPGVYRSASFEDLAGPAVPSPAP